MWIERRWLVTGLGFSLLVNVFLIGIVAGHFFASRGHQLPGVARALVPAVNVRALPPDERQQFRDAMIPYRPEILAARNDARKTRQAAEADIVAADFDRSKAVADLAAMRQATSRLQELVQDALVEALSKISPASRTALVIRNRQAPDGSDR